MFYQHSYILMGWIDSLKVSLFQNNWQEGFDHVQHGTQPLGDSFQPHTTQSNCVAAKPCQTVLRAQMLTAGGEIQPPRSGHVVPADLTTVQWHFISRMHQTSLLHPHSDGMRLQLGAHRGGLPEPNSGGIPVFPVRRTHSDHLAEVGWAARRWKAVWAWFLVNHVMIKKSASLKKIFFTLGFKPFFDQQESETSRGWTA